MEFLIAFGVTFLIGSLIKLGKKQEQNTKPSKPMVTNIIKADPDRQRKLQETDELITVILPTINNNK